MNRLLRFSVLIKKYRSLTVYAYGTTDSAEQLQIKRGGYDEASLCIQYTVSIILCGIEQSRIFRSLTNPATTTTPALRVKRVG